MNHHDITEILLKVAFNTINSQPLYYHDIFIVDIVVQIYLIPVILLCTLVLTGGIVLKRGYEGENYGINATFNNIYVIS